MRLKLWLGQRLLGLTLPDLLKVTFGVDTLAPEEPTGAPTLTSEGLVPGGFIGARTETTPTNKVLGEITVDGETMAIDIKNPYRCFIENALLANSMPFWQILCPTGM